MVIVKEQWFLVYKYVDHAHTHTHKQNVMAMKDVQSPYEPFVMFAAWHFS